VDADDLVTPALEQAPVTEAEPELAGSAPRRP
jgi:hypothetical protein